MSTYLLLAILRSGLHDLAQRFRCPPKNKLRLKPLGSGQKLSQLGNPGRIFQGEKRSPVGPGRIEGLEVAQPVRHLGLALHHVADRKSTRLNSSHVRISYAVFCLKKKKK